ncbi:hypothetical protein M407DRAFT_243245 [Tulasnella calospora MUT 4182]|uniref:Uncharacterized protein n=1 Tax=Tulasnella calospora MUT 4182 TaxID=1051891 RepID=A0A0C3M253_9AGAM|nr:hypothetical protein M407DRAFT_243245 [Tulasnella calospora MUT 4182]
MLEVERPSSLRTGERSSLLLHRDHSIPDRLRRLRLVKRLKSCYAWVTEDLSQRLRGLSTVNEDVTWH